ncbi:hypothetical protein Enr13x_28870 [Stieleria neptunia]|uniref:Uncharacterized protein n=1 Tax=Stieleria neptunia TaxID=2527979 RepID=A0A518HQB1_9BACT|nr:hypothetical protein Enr13x_28870 [Stieleria neptunia]
MVPICPTRPCLPSLPLLPSCSSLVDCRGGLPGVCPRWDLSVGVDCPGSVPGIVRPGGPRDCPGSVPGGLGLGIGVCPRVDGVCPRVDWVSGGLVDGVCPRVDGVCPRVDGLDRGAFWGVSRLRERRFGSWSGGWILPWPLRLPGSGGHWGCAGWRAVGWRAVARESFPAQLAIAKVEVAAADDDGGRLPGETLGVVDQSGKRDRS